MLPKKTVALKIIHGEFTSPGVGLRSLGSRAVERSTRLASLDGHAVVASAMFKHGRLSLVALIASTSLATAAGGASPSPAKKPEKESRVCTLVTPEEAASVLGPGAQRMPGDQIGTCFYVVKGKSMQLVLRIEDDMPASFLEVVRKPAMTEKGYTLQDEPSLGKGSFSARKADSLDFEIAVKGGVLDVGLRGNGGKVPPEKLDALRAVAQKASSRF
jgi:hypothetical protein